MKAFRFRADAVLAIRRRRRDAVQVELARAQQAERQAATDLASSEMKQCEAEQAYGEAIRAGGVVTPLERHRNWNAVLMNEVERKRQLHSEKAAAAVRCLETLAIAHKEVRVLERLRDRQWRRYLDAERRQEMKELDRIATLQYLRRSTERGTDHER